MIIKKTVYLKYSENKSPFFGISFNNEASEYCREVHCNLPLITTPIDMQIKLQETTMDIYLQASGMLYLNSYLNVSYNKPEFKSWIKTAQKSDNIYFGHVCGDSIVKLKDSTKPFYFPIRNILIINNQENKRIRIC